MIKYVRIVITYVMFFEAFALIAAIAIFISFQKIKNLSIKVGFILSIYLYALRIIQGIYVIRYRKSLHVILENNLIIIKKISGCKFVVLFFSNLPRGKSFLIYWIFSGSISTV